MRTSQAVGMVAVCIVAAFLVVVAVAPTIEHLQDPKLVTESNDPDYRLASVEGYEATISIASIDLDGIPRASYSVTEDGGSRSVTLQGYDTRVWHFGDGYVLLTSSGIKTPDGASLAVVGDMAEFSGGTLTAGAYSLAYETVSVPTEGGALGHYSGPFHATGGASFQLYGPYDAAAGTTSGVSGWTLDEEKGAGNFIVKGAKDPEGYEATGFVGAVEYVTISEADSFAAIIFDVVPLILLITLLAYAFMALGGGRE